nr:hypothetical protein OH820_14240 [Streptomyces sp. NBC_00857]
MTTATIAPAHAPHDAHRTGASAPGSASHSGSGHSARPVGNALRAVTVFFTTAFSVAVLGEYGEEAGIKRH